MIKSHPKALLGNVCYYCFKLKNLYINKPTKQYDKEILANVVNTEKEQDKDITPGHFQSFQ